jgi:predicted unusual protein kinase regulating ubiquinone biosynthesis (AarF/ABC1/UbiB family)
VSAPALQSLAETALRLARTTTSGRIVLAQLHALVPGPLVPEPLRPALAEAAARGAEPLRPREVERVLAAAWETPPADVLDELEREPHRVGPTEQVHRAVHDGAPVAVTVRRPGIAELLRADLQALDALALPLAGALPRLDARAALAEVRERALDELDLEHRAQAQRTLARTVGSDHPLLHVPAPVTRLCHDAVLVAPWVDGTPVGALGGADSAARTAAARGLVRLHAGSLRSGLLHADPRPDAAVLQADGRLAVAAVGATRTVAPARADLGLAALRALADEDDAAFGEALARLRWLEAQDGGEALELAWELFEELLAGPAVLDTRALLRAAERAAPRTEELLGLVVRAAPAPEDLLAGRMLGALALLLAPLAVELDWPEELHAALVHGLAPAA